MLESAVILLGAAIVAVPLFRLIGLGSVLGYLAAGVVIGPHGMGWFADAETILHVAELGVVMFLFVIGLEMRPSHLWSMRKDIFGLGTLQIVACALALTMVALLLGFPLPVALVGAWGFVLTSTAIVMQMLAERGDIAETRGQKVVAILLFEDLLIVPLLAVVSMLAPSEPGVETSRWMTLLIGTGALALLIAAGIWLLNPLFRILALARAREVMTAAALGVVLGAALLMDVGGLSMAMGAFLAGVLLSESTFRHEIEADIEPFRGILMGLFFMAVGMSLDLLVVAGNAQLVAVGVLALMAAKGVCVYGIARVLGTSHADALDRATLMAQGGEFAFVLFSAAANAKLINVEMNATLTAIVVISMVLTPFVLIAARKLAPAKAADSLDGVDVAEGLSGSVLIIGFGRFGQIASQCLLARGVKVSIIDNNIDMIRSAEKFGFKVYYGDGARLDVLRASGAETARAIAVCVDNREAANHIVELAKSQFPQAKLLVRAYDRGHALHLVRENVEFQIREVFESALAFGEAALRAVGVDNDAALAIREDIRGRDLARFEMQLAEGIRAGGNMLHHNMPMPVPVPAPLTPPRQEATVVLVDTPTEPSAPPSV